MPNRNSQTFGVEIECYGPNVRNRSVNGLRNAVANNNMHHGYDGSICPPRTKDRYGYSEYNCFWDGYEFKTYNPSKLEFLISDIVDFTNFLRNHNFHSNLSCGTHIHFGWLDQTNNLKHLKNLVFLFKHYQEMLYRIAGHNYRRETEYSEEITDSDFNVVNQRIDRDYSDFDVYYAFDNRYKGLNLESLDKHGTIEFRLFRATLKTEKLHAWLQIVNAMCNTAMSSDNLPVVNGKDTNLRNFYRDINLDEFFVKNNHFTLERTKNDIKNLIQTWRNSVRNR